jgi:hypothetical protein
MAITIAEKVLIVGGVLNLAYGTLLGYPITVIRAKGAPATPRYLMATHISTLLHAAVLLGLAWAARLSALGPGWHDVAAWLLVISSALIAAKDTLNWLTGVQDEFGEKAKTAPLGALGALGRQLVSESSSPASSQRCDARSRFRAEAASSRSAGTSCPSWRAIRGRYARFCSGLMEVAYRCRLPIGVVTCEAPGSLPHGRGRSLTPAASRPTTSAMRAARRSGRRVVESIQRR